MQVDFRYYLTSLAAVFFALFIGTLFGVAMKEGPTLHNQIQVLPVSTFDDNLRATIARSIYGSSLFQRYANSALPPIHIIVFNGRVILKGVVATNLERTQAELMARTRGMAFEVVNELVLEKDLKR